MLFFSERSNKHFSKIGHAHKYWCPFYYEINSHAKILLIIIAYVVSQQAATPTLPVSSTEARADAELPISTNDEQLNTIPRRLQKHTKT